MLYVYLFSYTEQKKSSNFNSYGPFGTEKKIIYNVVHYLWYLTVYFLSLYPVNYNFYKLFANIFAGFGNRYKVIKRSACFYAIVMNFEITADDSNHENCYEGEKNVIPFT